MKNSVKLFMILFFVLLQSPYFLFAQEQSENKENDVVVMLDGEEKKGKVMSIDDKEITFVYSGETLEYKFDLQKVNKIVFASGRTQMISETKTKNTTSNLSNPSSRKGKMAVLPFKIITNMPSVDKNAVGMQIQSDCANAIKEDAPMINVIDPRVINTTLAKHNITIESLDTMLPEELAILLDVEHVVFGSYDIENTGSMTLGSSVTTYKSKKEDEKRKGTAISSGSSSTTDTFNSKITIDIYSDEGSSIYSNSRKPFSAGLDKYHSTIKYLIKRAPFGSKR